MNAFKRVVQLGFTAYSSSVVNRIGHRQISQLVKSNGKRAFLVDTLALVLLSLFPIYFPRTSCLVAEETEE